MRFVTVTLHPSVDRILDLPAPEAEPREPPREVPAGKGVNTARMLRRIARPEDEVLAFAWVGRDRAPWFRRSLAAADIGFRACLRDAPTRACTTRLWPVGESHERAATDPALPREVRALFQAVARLPVRGAAVAVCGSAPPETPPWALGRVLALLRRRAAILVVDGEAWLDAGRALSLDGLKGNGAEVGRWLGLGDDVDPADEGHRKALGRLVFAPGGPRAILVTRGARGAVLVTRDRVLVATAPAPDGPPRMATGCGDAATAGWLLGLACRVPDGQALGLAVATGTAKLKYPDPGGGE